MLNKDLNQLIAEHYGFIIKTASDSLGRYVSVENDDAFSIALLAFQEAAEKHDEQRGPFLAFAKTVINSRLIDYVRKEQRHEEVASLDTLTEAGMQIEDRQTEEERLLAMEIESWKKLLASFGISMEQLVDESPKHSDTRERAIVIAETSSRNRQITNQLFQTKRLPIKRVALLNNVTIKIIKGSKTFITSTIIIFKKELRMLVAWIRR